MVTANSIYEKSLLILGETLDPASPDTAFFREAAPGYINLLLASLFELDCSLKGTRPHAGEAIPQIASLEEEIDYCDPISLSLLPLGLAYYLALEEDSARALFFYQQYNEEKATLRREYKCSRSTSVRELY